MSGRRELAAKGDPGLGDLARFGAKAVGLTRLPPDWTLPHFGVAVGTDVGTPGLKEHVAELLSRIGACPDGVLVRSSAVEEGLDERGAYESRRCPATAGAVLETISGLLQNVSDAVRLRLGFLIQRWAPDAALGHLSNERRVSRDPRSWLCEAELPVDIDERSFRFRIDSSSASSTDPQCDSMDRLPLVLRGAAKTVGRNKTRMHLEWVWDGQRVWLVQCDDDVTRVGSAPGSNWPGPAMSKIEGSLGVFVEAATCDLTRFPKVNNVSALRSVGLPHGDVKVLMDPDSIASLASGNVPRRLGADLDLLIQQPLVVRTDVQAPSGRPVLMSRRTDTCRTREELDDFLLTTSAELLDAGHLAENVAFLAHRFLLAEAGAFCLARPGRSRVRIDATWGLPDSLFFYPHDTIYADPERREVTKRVRCKAEYIDVDETGDWIPRTAGRPWDWRATLNDDVALQMAVSSTTLADSLGEELEIMMFIGVSADGLRWHLPWFFKHVERRSATPLLHSRGFYVGERARITNGSDISRLEARLQAEPDRRPVLTLRPEAHLLRERSFVEEVAKLASRRNLAVELEGSILSHAYYLLDQAGVAVRVADPHEEREPRRTFGKLVRDLVPVKIERRGELADVYHPEARELLPLIKAKLVEEALEHFWSQDDRGGIEELADLLELVRTAARIHGVEVDVVEEAAARKRQERGGFDTGVVLVETRGTDDFFGEERGLLDEEPRGARARALPRRQPIRLPLRRVVLPLVPPEGWVEGRAYVQPLDASDELALTYSRDEVLVEVRPRRAVPGADQLTLEI